MQLLEDGERFRVIARILYVPPRAVSRLWISYQKTGEYTGKHGQSRSRTITPMHDRFLVLLSRHNHTSTAKALEIDSRYATEVHLNDQTVRNKLHCDGVRGRRPVQCPVISAIQLCLPAS